MQDHQEINDNGLKIFAIVQIYNELSSGNLIQFMHYHRNVFDKVIVYDDGSTDGSAEYCKSQGAIVISSTTNNFKDEISHKEKLIHLATELGAEFIISLDADEVLSVSRQSLILLCNEIIDRNLDGLQSNYINLWRSTSHVRTDALFDDFKPVKLWRNRPELTPFQHKLEGLHQKLYPDYVRNFTFCDRLTILHTGFSTKEKILEKFVRYRSLGQRGFELLRFVDEANIKFKKVPEALFPSDWQHTDDEPQPISIEEYFSTLPIVRERVLRPKVSIICLIYKDIGWLEFIYQQVARYTNLKQVEFFFVANNPEPHVLTYLRENFIPFYDFIPSAEQRKENYINNVYRAYNYGVERAKGDVVVMLNSDMALSDGWLEALLSKLDHGTCVSSRLVEPGVLATGRHGIVKNFGKHWSKYSEELFQSYVKEIGRDEIADGGLFMPLAIRKSDFCRVGGYPAGNIIEGTDPYENKIAQPDNPVTSGDVAFIDKLSRVNVKHHTAMNSVVYHFQEGERRSNESVIAESATKKIAICNNSISGINGEKVLWGHLLELPNTLGLDYSVVSGKTPYAFESFVRDKGFEIIFSLQNASFMPIFLKSTFTAVYLQDNLRGMYGGNAQQERNLLAADFLIANSIYTASSYPEFDFEICSVGVDAKLFQPLNKSDMRSKYGLSSSEKVGIFVGALDDVKGWSEVKRIIDVETAVTWIIVSKYSQRFDRPNVKFFSMLPQNILVELLNCADFFILGSPVETQCLAAIEAALCNVPVIMKPVGVFATFSDSDKRRVGWISDNLHESVRSALAARHVCAPRQVMLEKRFSLEDSMEDWWRLFAYIKLQSINKHRFEDELRRSQSVKLSSVFYKVEVFIRFRILKRIIGRDTFYTIAEISVYLKRNLPRPVFGAARALWRFIRG